MDEKNGNMRKMWESLLEIFNLRSITDRLNQCYYFWLKIKKYKVSFCYFYKDDDLTFEIEMDDHRFVFYFDIDIENVGTIKDKDKITIFTGEFTLEFYGIQEKKLKKFELLDVEKNFQLKIE